MNVIQWMISFVVILSNAASFVIIDTGQTNFEVIMMKQQAIEKINQVSEQSRIGVLSTAVNNKPNSRYMIFYNDDLD